VLEAKQLPKTSGLTAVVSAMAEELGPLMVRTRIARKARVGNGRAYVGVLGKAPVVLSYTGDGRGRAESGIRALLEHYPVERMLVIGISGGLSPALPSGELLVAHDVRDAEGQAPAPDPDWVEEMLIDAGACRATVVSSDRILGTAASKAEAWARLDQSRPAAVDLETASYARVAAELGVKYAVVRAVCDPADEELPLDLDSCRDKAGGVSRVKVVRQALLHPSSVGGLWDLRQRVVLCSVKLADFVERLLNRGTS